MFDILFFALLAGFLILKLNKTLGVREKDDEKRKNAAEQFAKQYKKNVDLKNKIIDLVQARNESTDYDFGFDLDSKIKGKLIDMGFSEKKFLKGAENAMEMVNDAFSKKDLKTLKFILDDDSFENFKKKIEALGDKVAKSSIVAILEKKIDSIKFENDSFFIDVLFKTQQTNYIEDAEGNVVFGSKKDITNLDEVWVFTRNSKTKENFWQLSSIEERHNA